MHEDDDEEPEEENGRLRSGDGSSVGGEALLRLTSDAVESSERSSSPFYPRRPPASSAASCLEAIQRLRRPGEEVEGARPSSLGADSSFPGVSASGKSEDLRKLTRLSNLVDAPTLPPPTPATSSSVGSPEDSLNAFEEATDMKG